MSAAGTGGRDPIGLWLKRADGALTAAFARELAALGLSRTAWQVLNVVRAGAARPQDVHTALAPFAGAPALDAVLDDLRTRDLLAPGPPLALTPEGTALLDRAGAQVAGLRRRTVAGVSEEEYAITLRVLERLVANLEGDGAAAGEPAQASAGPRAPVPGGPAEPAPAGTASAPPLGDRRPRPLRRGAPDEPHAPGRLVDDVARSPAPSCPRS